MIDFSRNILVFIISAFLCALSSSICSAQVSFKVINSSDGQSYAIEEFKNLNTGNTISLLSIPSSYDFTLWEIQRNGLGQTIGDNTKDTSVSGTNITFNYRDFDGEKVRVKYPISN